MKLWRLLAEYNAESKTYTACAGTNAPIPYAPEFNGRLIGLRSIVSADGATTLTQGVQFKLTCVAFKPNSIECGAQGDGLQTVPQHIQGIIDWQVDQPIIASVPVTVEARNMTADTPVGVLVHLWGLFEI